MPVEKLPSCDYCIIVSRYEKRPRVGIWPVALSEPLPVVPIPLRAPDSDAQLDLQAVVHDVYDAARYETYIYHGNPDPPLTREQETWSRHFIPKQPGGVRQM